MSLLVGARLPSAGARLDAFEESEMQRLLVTLEQGGTVLGVANVYALRRAMTAVLGQRRHEATDVMLGLGPSIHSEACWNRAVGSMDPWDKPEGDRRG